MKVHDHLQSWPMPRNYPIPPPKPKPPKQPAPAPKKDGMWNKIRDLLKPKYPEGTKPKNKWGGGGPVYPDDAVKPQRPPKDPKHDVQQVCLNYIKA